MADTKIHHQNKPNPTKFYSRFLYKALVVTIFLVILPIFPSQAPDFITQNLNTRGWEFLHLIFVGIAVSYGLFSRRNDESDKDNGPSKFDNAQSYVSKFLQVSSVFDDEVDSPGPSRSDGVPTVQTWNNQYYRNEPVVVVADQNSVLHQDQKKSSNSRVGEKPLLLPVRSLKSRVFDADAVEESLNSPARFNTNLNSKRFSSNLEENLKNNVVLPSPIPWRSRSGRIEFKEEQPNSPTLYSQPSSSMQESEFNRSLKGQTSRVSRSDSSTSSPKLSSSPNKFSIETQGKCAEDFVRKKSIYRSPPPPPPPPPPPTPPHLIRKSKLTKPIDDEIFSPRQSSTREAKLFRSSRIDEFTQSSVKTEKLNRERVSFMAQPTVMEFPEEEKEVEKLVLESEEDLETEDEEDDEIETDTFLSVPSGGPGGGGSSSGDSGPDVDKKADEFIAKFREQIRLQRIESIKRSSGQINRKIKR